ncbi:MAG: helix-turn-helix transcriptional regulator [Pelobium sp.]
MKVAILNIEDIEVEEFEIQFDISALFKKFDYLNISKVADRAGINPSLLRQYVSQVKNPSEVQAKKLENTLHILADELKGIHIYA